MSSRFVVLIWLGVLAMAAAGCGSAEKARREAEMAALMKQVEELRKGQDQTNKEVARLAGELKALDAQAAFLVGEAKTSGQEREQLKGAVQQQDEALRSLRSALEETNQKVGALSVPSPAVPAATPTPPSGGPEVTAEKLYAAAMASFRADEHGQAVLQFTELIEKFPKHALAASAQYWIGEAYYRQRDFNQALTEFQKVPDLYPRSGPAAESLLKVGLCYRALHDVPRARETWEQVLKSYPKSDAATQARTLIASLGASGRPSR
ncbi:MAG TPA: tol-pal system protein YbgF [Methylomirabilota bacterium]|nr:tol-pal system protein YbgF [Methylomirabilota bacterium]